MTSSFKDPIFGFQVVVHVGGYNDLRHNVPLEVDDPGVAFEPAPGEEETRFELSVKEAEKEDPPAYVLDCEGFAVLHVVTEVDYTPPFHSVLAHEIVHLADCFFRRHYIPRIDETDETYASVVGYFTEQVIEILRRLPPVVSTAPPGALKAGGGTLDSAVVEG